MTLSGGFGGTNTLKEGIKMALACLTIIYQMCLVDMLVMVV